MKKPDKYASIRAWCQMMGSYQYYINDQLALAKETNAPEGATYQNDDGTWNTLAGVTNQATIRHFEMHHPDLYEKFMSKAGV